MKDGQKNCLISGHWNRRGNRLHVEGDNQLHGEATSAERQESTGTDYNKEREAGSHWERLLLIKGLVLHNEAFCLFYEL